MPCREEVAVSVRTPPRPAVLPSDAPRCAKGTAQRCCSSELAGRARRRAERANTIVSAGEWRVVGGEGADGGAECGGGGVYSELVAITEAGPAIISALAPASIQPTPRSCTGPAGDCGENLPVGGNELIARRLNSARDDDNFSASRSGVRELAGQLYTSTTDTSLWGPLLVCCSSCVSRASSWPPSRACSVH